MITGVYLLSFLLTYFPTRKIVGHQKVGEGNYYVGDTVEIESFVENDSLGFLPSIEIWDRTVEKLTNKPSKSTITFLGPMKREIVRESITTKYRGIYNMGPLDINVSDALNLFTWKRRIQAEDFFKVYPRIHNIENFNLKSMQSYGTMTTKQRAYEDNSSVSDIRKYVSGDSMKKIHWKVSARKNSFHVKNYEMTGSAFSYIFLDFKKGSFKGENSLDLEEKAVETAASIASFMLKNSVSINMYVNCSKLCYTKGRDVKEIINFLELLSEVKPDGQNTMKDVIEKRIRLISSGASVIIITGNMTEEELSIYCAVKNMGFDLIIAYVNDEKMIEDKRILLEKSDIKIYHIDSESDIKGVLEAI
jgi:uncharacterized protein (DUF58 family)